MITRVRVLTAVAACLCAVAFLLPRPGLTGAAFTDAEYAAGGTFTATTLSNPTNMTCSVTKTANILTSVTVTWQSAYPLTPTTVPITTLTSNPSGYAGTITPSGTGPYTYTMVLDQGLLGGIINNLAGSTVVFTVDNQAGTSWKTASLTKTLTTGVGGLNPKCP